MGRHTFAGPLAAQDFPCGLFIRALLDIEEQRLETYRVAAYPVWLTYAAGKKSWAAYVKDLGLDKGRLHRKVGRQAKADPKWLQETYAKAARIRDADLAQQKG